MRSFPGIVIALALLGGAARAEDAPTQEDIELAKSRFATAQVLYERGRYAEALVEFEAAKRVLARPQFDYNIGRCLAKLGRQAEAADALERYVKSRPDDPDAGGIWQMIAELRAEVVRSAGGTPEVRPAEPVVAPPPPVVVPPIQRRGLLQTPLGRGALALGAAGVAALVAGAAAGGLALARRGEYDDSCALACDGARYDAAHRLALATDVLIGVGVAAIGAAVVMAVLDRRSERSRLSTVRLGRSLAWEVSF